MRIVNSICRKGSAEFNEDNIGNSDNCAWVIDGATDVFDRHAILHDDNEVEWYVTRLNDALTAKANESEPLADILRNAVLDIATSIISVSGIDDVPEYMLPTFAIAIVRVSHNILEYCVLGDCSIHVVGVSRFETIRDRRIEPFTKENRKRLSALPKNDLSGRMSVLRNTRTYANAIDGYPIGSVYGTGINQALTGEIELKDDERVLICSDGIDGYLANVPSAVRDISFAEDFNNEMEKLSRFLHDGDTLKRNSYPKRIDDQSIIVLEP